MGAGLCWGLWSHRHSACGPVWKDEEMAGKCHLLARGAFLLICVPQAGPGDRPSVSALNCSFLRLQLYSCVLVVLSRCKCPAVFLPFFHFFLIL